MENFMREVKMGLKISLLEDFISYRPVITIQFCLAGRERTTHMIPRKNKSQGEDPRSLLSIRDHVGRRIEVIAFGIAYIGTLEAVDLQEGIISLSDGGESAVLELERVEAYFPIDEAKQSQ